MIQIKQSSHRYLTLFTLFVSLVLLFITQYIFNLTYWFDLDLTFLGFLSPLACIWPDFCNTLRFPSYGFIALLTAMLAAILFGGLFVWQKVPNFLTELNFPTIEIPNHIRLNYQIDVPLFIIFGSCQVYVIVQAIGDRPVTPTIWLLGLLALLALGFRLDQSHTRTVSWQLLSPTFLNVLYVSGIASLLLTTAALHSQHWPWALFFGTLTVLLWLRVFISLWQSWDIPSRLERLMLPLITLGSFLLFSANLNNWAWSFWGDEFPFYNLGQRFVNGTMTVPILSGAGVFGIHPALSSAWQGVTMWLFGSDGYGWRVSNSLLLAISIPFLYYFLGPILGRTGGLFAVTLYGSAHVLLSFGHYGANNSQTIFIMATALAAFIWAGRHGSWTGFLLVGVCLGLGFYTFAVARIYSLMIIIWLTIYYFPIDFQRRRITWVNSGVWLAVIGTTLLTALPVLSTRSVWGKLANQTVFASEVAFTPYDQYIQFLRNIFYGFTSFLFNDQNSHWVFGAHADPITSTLMVIGLAALISTGKQAWRVRAGLLTSYLTLVIIIAGTQQYSYPSITRIFAFVPFYAIFASIGFLALGHSIIASKIQNRSTQFPEIILISLGIVAALIITLLNIWQSVVLSQKHSRQSPPALLLQAAQMSADETGGGPHLFYVGNDIGSKPQYNHASEYYAKLVYSIHNIPLDRFTFISFNDILLPENAICQSADQPAIAIITTKIQNAGYIASKINQCWPGAELRLIKDVNKTAIHYRLINESALPFINSVDGYWIEEEMPQTVLTQSSEKRSDWAVYQPVGISQNSKGQLAVVEAATKQVVFLDANGRVKNILGNVFANPSDISFLPDDGFVIADADRGLLWFDANGHFRFMSNGGEKPRGLSVAADGTVYVAPAGNQFILQLGNNGELLRTIEGPQFEQPTSIAVAVDGRIAVGDPVAGKIFVSSNNGELLSEYPIGVGDTSIGKPGLLWLQNGSLIFTDPANNRIIWVDPNGKTLKEWSNLKSPTDIILQSTNKLLVLECYDNRIVLIELK